MESEIQETSLVESGIVGFVIWNTALGVRIPLTIGIRNLSSTDKESAIQYLESEILGVESRIQRLSYIPFHGARSGFVFVIIEMMSFWEWASLSIIVVFFPCSLPF